MLQIAETLRNVSDACRIMGCSRNQFYEVKRTFQTHGFEGLMDKPPIPKNVPGKTPLKIEKKVIDLSISHPAWGQQRIADELGLENIQIAATTVRNIWIGKDLETRYKRLLALEEKTYKEDITLTEEQIRLLEKANPEFGERNVESPYPGYLLSQDTFYVGRLKRVGRICLQAVADVFSPFAFAKLYITKIAITAVDVLYDRVIPFYELFLALNDIEHRLCKVGTSRTNGFVERFNRTALDEFFREVFRKKSYSSLEELQTDLDTWIHHYNFKRPHRGYRNQGRRPYETFTQGKKSLNKESKAQEVKSDKVA